MIILSNRWSGSNEYGAWEMHVEVLEGNSEVLGAMELRDRLQSWGNGFREANSGKIGPELRGSKRLFAWFVQGVAPGRRWYPCY